MPTQKRVYTRDDLTRLPDDWWVELVDGDLVMAPSPVAWHPLLVNRLNLRLAEHLGPDDEDRLLPAPLDLAIDTHNVYQPDLMVLEAGVSGTGPGWQIPTPIWVAEVISPYTAQHDLKKLPLYAAKGVREAWLIYPSAERVVIHEFTSDAVTEYVRPRSAPSSALPGFALDLDRFFAARK